LVPLKIRSHSTWALPLPSTDSAKLPMRPVVCDGAPARASAMSTSWNTPVALLA